MDNTTSSEPVKTPSEDGATAGPAPVTLKTRNDQGGEAQPTEGAGSAKPIHLTRRSFRPSHKATFIGLTIIIVLIAANAAIVIFVIKRQAKQTADQTLGKVSLDKAQLEQLGVSQTAIGTSDDALVVSPNARFSGTVTVDKEIKLNNKLTGTGASLGDLQAGNTSLTQLNVNGSTTLTSATVRSDFTVSGTTRLQGAVTLDKLLTVNSGLNVVGDLNVGGALSTSNFSARNLTAISTLTVGGHIVSNGSLPGIVGGAAPGPSGTVSLSGNDSTGTIAMNTGQAPVAGVIATVTFHTPYSNIPHVIVTPVGSPTGNLQYYINRTATGFTIATNNAPAAASGFVFDYIVMQ